MCFDVCGVFIAIIVYSQLQCVVPYIVCIFLMFVVDAVGDHIVETYYIKGLNVESNASFCLPHLVEERSIGIVLDALAACLSMCLS